MKCSLRAYRLTRRHANKHSSAEWIVDVTDRCLRVQQRLLPAQIVQHRIGSIHITDQRRVIVHDVTTDWRPLSIGREADLTRPVLNIADTVLTITRVATRNRIRRQRRGKLVLCCLLRCNWRGRRDRGFMMTKQAAKRGEYSRLSVEREGSADALAEWLESGGITLGVALEERVIAVEAETG